jgi:hypothetical protein
MGDSYNASVYLSFWNTVIKTIKLDMSSKVELKLVRVRAV